MGRLSNPPEPVEVVIDQGSQDSRRRRRGVKTPPDSRLGGDHAVSDEETGQLSNPRRPVQRRLSNLEIDELVDEYHTGRTLADLASVLGIHRRTAAAHLQARGIERRVNRRKMTDDDAFEAVLSRPKEEGIEMKIDALRTTMSDCAESKARQDGRYP